MNIISWDKVLLWDFLFYFTVAMSIYFYMADVEYLARYTDIE